jgi:putative ABC transport system permease protein
MIRNYITVAFRNIVRYKVFSFINIFGLAAAMSVCMLIILMLADQDRYDKFHVHHDRIYRILSDYEGSRMAYATSAEPVGPALKSRYGDVEDATTLIQGVGGDVSYNQKVAEIHGYFADTSFFNIFSFELEKGHRASALRAPNSIVLTSKLATQLFGHEDPIGKIVEIADRQLPFPISHTAYSTNSKPWGSFTVTGVVDMDRYISHLKFEALVSSASLPALYADTIIQDRSNQWAWFFHTYTYALLDEHKKQADLEAALADLTKREYAKLKSEEVKGFRLLAQPLDEVQLNLAANDTNERMPRVGYYFLSVLAAIIMLSACLNYTNLSVARALTRAKEIGVRKVTGAARKSLVVQFLSESVIVALLSVGMAIVLLLFLKPAFQSLWVNKFLNFQLPVLPSVYLYFLAFAVVIGVLAGAYPAFHLSGYQPVTVLKRLDALKPGKLGLRKVLSVTQFVISLFFITTSILVFNQFKHYMEFDYGFKSENIVNVELQGLDHRKLAAEFSQIAGVSTISATDIIPGLDRNNGGEVRKMGDNGEYTRTGVLETDEHFVANLGLKMIAGRDLPAEGEGTDRLVLVNRQMVVALGYTDPRDIVGQVLETKWGQEALEVVGVVDNFRDRMLINRHEFTPLVMRNRSSQFMYLNVKVTSPDLIGTVGEMEQTWKRIDNVHPFKYDFFDDQLAATHRGIFDLASVLGFIAVLAIIISCLGLLGMVTYTAERKRKEVGIRKVLGAPLARIALLLSRDLIIVLSLAVCIGAPLSYMLNNLWLQSFPNRVEFGVGTVVLGTSILLALGLLTITAQIFKAARHNPVEALKNE